MSRRVGVNTARQASSTAPAPIPVLGRVLLATCLASLLATQTSLELMTAVAMLTFKVSAGGCVLYGLTRYRPSGTGVWWCWAAYFVLSAMRFGRQVLVVLGGDGWDLRRSNTAWELAFTSTSAIALMMASVLLLRARVKDRAEWALADAVVVSAGLLVAFLTLVTLPMYAAQGLTTSFATIGVISVVRDVVVVVPAVTLLYSEQVRSASLAVFCVVFPLSLAADLAFLSMNSLQVAPWSEAVLFLVALLGQAGVAMVAVHPSMTTMAAPTTSPRAGWNAGRTLTLAAGLVAPVLAVAVAPPESAAARRMLLAAALALVSLLVWRMRRSVVRILEAMAQLRHLADHDALTGLPNRRYLYGHFTDTVAGLSTDRRPLALIACYLDLDNLRDINDRLTHDAGDRLLIAVGQELERVVASADDGVITAIRMGGDEFVVVHVLWDDVDPHARASLLAEAVHAGLDDLRLAGLDVAGSTGTSVVVPRDDQPLGDHMELVISQADLAQTSAKRVGGGRTVRYEQSIGSMVRRRARLRQALPRALERGELDLHYQPVLDLRSGEVFGAEALLRWTLPDRTSVPPPEAIDVAIRHGLIHRLGHELVDIAVADLRSLSLPGELRIGLNVSAPQLRPGAVELLFQRLQGTGLIGRFWIEVTEQTLVVERRVAAGALADLRAGGIKVAIDDFGTGYCGLDYLCTLPIDLVKLDGVFVRESVHSPVHERVARLGGQLAEAVGAEVVVEGIETPEMLRRARSWGCRYGQGYGIGRPTADIRAAMTDATGTGSGLG